MGSKRRGDYEIYKDIGFRISLLRQKAGLTQEKLAGIGGHRRRLVASWEIGTTRISIYDLLLIAKALGVTVQDILDGISAENAPK